MTAMPKWLLSGTFACKHRTKLNKRQCVRRFNLIAPNTARRGGWEQNDKTRSQTKYLNQQ